jgi:hypothetical protein
MPKFTTSIQLQEASEKACAILSREMKKNFFTPVSEIKVDQKGRLVSTFVFNSSNYKSLLDTTTVVSQVAATTGRKFSFTVIREKTKPES